MAQIKADFDVFVDGVNLQAIPYLTITKRDPNQMARKKTFEFELPERDGMIIVGQQFTSKPIQLEGWITAHNRLDYERSLQQLYRAIRKAVCYLSLETNGQIVRYKGKFIDPAIEFIEAGKARVPLDFVCTDPFGQDVTETIIEDAGVTTVPHLMSEDFDSTNKVTPIVEVTVNSGTGLTSKTITLQNSLTGQFISITRTWTAGDKLVVDMDKKVVSVNSGIIEPVGIFPKFDPGVERLTYSDDFTTRNVTIRIRYVRRYF